MEDLLVVIQAKEKFNHAASEAYNFPGNCFFFFTVPSPTECLGYVTIYIKVYYICQSCGVQTHELECMSA